MHAHPQLPRLCGVHTQQQPVQGRRGRGRLKGRAAEQREQRRHRPALRLCHRRLDGAHRTQLLPLAQLRGKRGQPVARSAFTPRRSARPAAAAAAATAARTAARLNGGARGGGVGSNGRRRSGLCRRSVALDGRSRLARCRAQHVVGEALDLHVRLVCLDALDVLAPGHVPEARPGTQLSDLFEQRRQQSLQLRRHQLPLLSRLDPASLRGDKKAVQLALELGDSRMVVRQQRAQAASAFIPRRLARCGGTHDWHRSGSRGSRAIVAAATATGGGVIRRHRMRRHRVPAVTKAVHASLL